MKVCVKEQNLIGDKGTFDTFDQTFKKSKKKRLQ